MKRPIVYEYLDYRTFLDDFFRFRKEQRSTFSYRFFARKAGFSSPNFLKLVTNSQRNLTNESAAKIARGFGLKKQEREFFENLVFMNQSPSHEEKKFYYEKMAVYRGYSKVHTLERDAYDYYSTWYCPVVREIVILGNHDHTAEDIAGLLIPKITPAQAQKTLDLLLRLELIKRDKTGHWQQTAKVLSTGPEVQSLTLANFQKEMIRLAAESIDRIPAKGRDITSLTLSVKNEMISEIKRKIASLRKELLNLACEYEENADQVMQINFQAFPVSNKDGRKKK